MFHSLNRSTLSFHYAMENLIIPSTPLLSPKSPIDMVATATVLPPIELPIGAIPAKSPLSGSSSSSFTAENGTSPFKPRTAQEILADESMPTPTATLLDSKKSSASSLSFPSSSTATEVSTRATSVSESQEKKAAPAAAGNVKVAERPSDTVQYDAEKQKAEDNKRKASEEWIARYAKAQPSGSLLKPSDTEYIALMAAFRKEQAAKAPLVKKEPEAAVANGTEVGAVNGKKEKEKRWARF